MHAVQHQDSKRTCNTSRISMASTSRHLCSNNWKSSWVKFHMWIFTLILTPTRLTCSWTLCSCMMTTS